MKKKKSKSFYIKVAVMFVATMCLTVLILLGAREFVYATGAVSSFLWIMVIILFGEITIGDE